MKTILRAGGMLSAGLLMAVCGCGGGSSAASGRTSDKPLVVTSTTMITDLARQIGGDHVQVVGIIPPGMDPHTYEPRPDDSILMRKAALILYNGLHLEGQMVHMFENAAARAVALAEDPRITPRGSETYHGAPDPHCWWDARLFRIYAERTRDALIEVCPDRADALRAAADAYDAQLADVHERIRHAVQRIPPERRVLITSHDAFYYYGAAYGLAVDAVIGISTEASVRPLRIEELARRVVHHRIPAIFHETSVSQALNDMVTRVVELAARQGYAVRIPDEALYSDSLAEPGTPAGTYIGALRENTRIIVGALAGADVRELLEPSGGSHERHDDP